MYTFVLYQTLEAAINVKQPNFCWSFITSSICSNPFGALNHTYPELSVARATLVFVGDSTTNEENEYAIKGVILLHKSLSRRYYFFNSAQDRQPNLIFFVVDLLATSTQVIVTSLKTSENVLLANLTSQYFFMHF